VNPLSSCQKGRSNKLRGFIRKLRASADRHHQR
jgi:hypothetical protein